MFEVGGCQLSVADPVVWEPVTEMENGASALEARPPLTVMRTSLKTPVDDVDGVPLSRPVLVSNVAHAGLLEIWNVSASPSRSLALGWNE